jgi:uncharacterized protein YjbI with pentapeptide repeats
MTKFQSHTSDLPEKIKITSKSLIFLSLTKAVVLMGAVISILALLFVPKLQVHSAKLTDKERIELENANRTTLVQALGGLFFFSTAYFTWRNLQIAEENLKVTEKNFNQNIKVAEDKQITESFAKAVELLGSEIIHVRIGGIYALERIAKDSNKDFWQIIEILTAYIREKSPYDPYKKIIYLDILQDVKIAVTVIIRMTKDFPFDDEYCLDLSRTNLSRLILRDANLEYAKFEEANLSFANLQNARLNNAKLQRANLQNACLKKAILIKANLDSELNYNEPEEYQLKTDLLESNLEGANLEGANLESVNLSGANLSYSILIEANLKNTYMLGTYPELISDIDGSEPGCTYLYDAELSGTDFTYAELNPEQVKEGKNWDKAIYNNEFRNQLFLS